METSPFVGDFPSGKLPWKFTMLFMGKLTDYYKWQFPKSYAKLPEGIKHGEKHRVIKDKSGNHDAVRKASKIVYRGII